jgi:hypothetical protein
LQACFENKTRPISIIKRQGFIGYSFVIGIVYFLEKIALHTKKIVDVAFKRDAHKKGINRCLDIDTIVSLIYACGTDRKDRSCVNLKVWVYF